MKFIVAFTVLIIPIASVSYTSHQNSLNFLLIPYEFNKKKLQVSAAWPGFLNDVLNPFAQWFRFMGLPIRDKPSYYEDVDRPCVDGSGADCNRLYDLAEHNANIFPITYNRMKPKEIDAAVKPLQPNRAKASESDEYDNCKQETPMLMVRPLSQRYIIMSNTPDLMYSQRFYPKVHEMFIRSADGGIKQTLGDYFARISSGNINYPAPVVFKPRFSKGGKDNDMDVTSGDLMVGQRAN